VPEKYVRREGLPLLVRHTGPTTLPEAPPFVGVDRPDGRGIVCLHDAGLQSSVFEDLLKALEAEGESALAFDLPGHGRSGSLDSLPSIEAMAEMAAWVTNGCRIDRPLVVGHGMGALVALEWARTNPESVGGLVLCAVGAALGIDSEAIEQMRQVTRGKAPRPFDPSRLCKESGREIMQRAYMEGIKTDPRATLVDLESSRAWSRTFATERSTWRLECPLRVVSGAAEPPSNRERAESLVTLSASASTPASTHVIDGAAHFVPLENPTALCKEIRSCVVAESAVRGGAS
jgi:pimeloyl-ACP methyl ester carboxylesterase